MEKHSITKIPWGHIKLLIGKIKNHQAAHFYIQQTIENNWSRDVLDLQIKSDPSSARLQRVPTFIKPQVVAFATRIF